MGMNITHTMNNFNFENKQNLRNTAKDILNRQGASNNSMQNILNQTIFGSENNSSDIFVNPQLAILKASNQISANNSLKETLKYLKQQANKKNQKKAILGDIWNNFNENVKEPYQGELLDFEIDNNAHNIFEAA